MPSRALPPSISLAHSLTHSLSHHLPSHFHILDSHFSLTLSGTKSLSLPYCTLVPALIRFLDGEAISVPDIVDALYPKTAYPDREEREQFRFDLSFGRLVDLQTCGNLADLDLANMGLCMLRASMVVHLTNLQRLSLANNAFDDQGLLDSRLNVLRLQHLDLSGNPVLF